MTGEGRSPGPAQVPTPIWIWAGAAGAALVLVPWWSRLLSFAPACLLHEVTGFPCPTCGSGRAALALLRGEVPGAFVQNPLAAAGILLFLAGGLLAPLWWRLGFPRPLRAPGKRMVLVLAGLAFAQWVYLALRGV